jgi:hypothetical protein
LGISECHGIILVRLATASRAVTTEAPQQPTAGGVDPRSAACALQGPNGHALFAAEIQYFVGENIALSGVSAVVTSSWLLRAAAFQKAPFKMTFAGSNPPCPSQPVGSLRLVSVPPRKACDSSVRWHCPRRSLQRSARLDLFGFALALIEPS